MSLALALWLSHAAPPAEARLDCGGQALPVCAAGWTGPTCDLPCAGAERCDHALYCHGDGGTHGLSTFGAYLFASRPDASAAELTSSLVRWIAGRPERLGLASGVAATDLDLRPAAAFRGRAEALTLLRFDQRYRGVPVFGPDARVTLVADGRGVVAIRGALVDPRVAYAHLDAPAPASIARDSIRAHAEVWTKLPAASLRVDDLRLVAVPRARAIGWAGRVAHGLAHVATVVVAADPSLAVLPLLYVSKARSEGIDDPAPISALAEDPASDVLEIPAELAKLDALFDGSPLLGSQGSGGTSRLATETVVVLDATGETVMAHESLPLIQEEDASFAATAGAPQFLAQDAFVALASAYRWTAQFMDGRWESTTPVPEGGAPLTPPGQFEPRVHVLTNLAEVPCMGSACFHGVIVQYNKPPEEHFRQPLDASGPRWEDQGRIAMPASDPVGGGMWRATLLHEFGHFVDNFAAPGVIDDGFGCLGDIECQPSCAEDTTDEAAPLKETWAQIAAILYLRSLYAVGADPARCDLLPLVSTGESGSPHHAACRSPIEPFSLFLRDGDPDCPRTDDYQCHQFAADWPACKTRCDKPRLSGWEQDGAGASKPTGLCQTRAGYGADSLFQALWELLHAQECSEEPPYTCVPLVALAQADAERTLGAALHYALRLDTATYRGFFDDVATHVACNAGSGVYAEVNRVLCHHHLRPCDGPIPVACAVCGDGIRGVDEACDGADLGGLTCEALGHAAGALACTPACTLDASPCFDPVPTEGGGGTTGVDEPDPDGATATAGAGAIDDGCACASAPVRGRLAALALAALLAARRRRRALARLALLAAASGTLACTQREPVDTGDDTGVTGDGASASSTGAATIDPRFFDVFYPAELEIGYRNTDPKTLFFWDDLEIRADHTATYHERSCAKEPLDTHALVWTHDAAAGVLRLVPGADGRIQFGVCSATAVELALGETCGELWARLSDPEGCSDHEELVFHYSPGRVCAETFEVEDQMHVGGPACFFEFVWCDERPLPACQAP